MSPSLIVLFASIMRGFLKTASSGSVCLSLLSPLNEINFSIKPFSIVSDGQRTSTLSTSPNPSIIWAIP
nr:hypothetical protein [Thermodesulfovibrio islandicus]